MSKYELVSDACNRLELDSTFYSDACEEALEKLGWYIYETGEDENEQD